MSTTTNSWNSNLFNLPTPYTIEWYVNGYLNGELFKSVEGLAFFNIFAVVFLLFGWLFFLLVIIIVCLPIVGLAIDTAFFSAVLSPLLIVGLPGLAVYFM